MNNNKEIMTEQELNYACEWLEFNAGGYLGLVHEESMACATLHTAKMIKDFREAMSNCGEIAIDKPTWHKVSEELPKEEAFLVRKIDNPQVYAVLIYSHKKKGFWNTITGGFNTIDGVLEYYTHWMKIPKIKKD